MLLSEAKQPPAKGDGLVLMREMKEGKNLTSDAKDFVQLDGGEEFANDSAVLVEEETVREFNEKSDFLLKKSRSNPFEFNEIYLRDFIELIFERKDGTGKEVEPFEEEASHEYLDVWKPQHDKGVEEYDYTGYGVWRYNAIALYKEKKNGELINRHCIILKDSANSEKLDFLESRVFGIMSPITYVGRNRYAKNARYLYAFAFDLDGVGIKQLRDVLYQQRTDLMSTEDGSVRKPHAPMANIIVNSGHGLHLYYLLEHPVALYKENIPLLRKMKEGLTNIVWNEFTSNMKDIQYQGIFQGFRIPGTCTKFGEKIRAFKNVDAEMHSVRSLNGFLSKFKLTDEEISQLEGKTPYNPSGKTLEEAKRLYPEWYERVIVLGDKRPKKWHIKRDLYDWWLRRLRDLDETIVPGHRYFCMLTLAIYAMKCDIEREELVRDAYSLLKRMDDLTDEEDNHFTRQDIEDALMGYKLWYCTFPRNSIKYLTGLEMKANRRNGRKQDIHLKRARAVQMIDDPKGDWRKGNGRKHETIENSKIAWRVREWMLKFPDNHNKSECARELGLTRPTVRKWWKQIEERELGWDDIPTPVFYGEMTIEELKKAIVEPDSEIVPKLVICKDKILEPGSVLTIPGYTHEEVVEIITSGKWRELGWELSN